MKTAWALVVGLIVCGVVAAGEPVGSARPPTSVVTKRILGADWHTEQGALVPGDGVVAWCDMSFEFPNMVADPLVFRGFAPGPMPAGAVLVVKAQRIGLDPAIFVNAIVKNGAQVVAGTELLGVYPALTNELVCYRLRLVADVADIGQCSVWVGASASGLASSRVGLDGAWFE